MNAFRQMLSVTALAMGVALPLSGFAQATMDHGKMDMTAPAMADGEVKKVDVEAGKITIKHGYIQSLDMPGMTMVFTARDKAQLANVRPGDRIRFMAVMDGSRMVVTDIEPAR
jgi:Cu(I)/Ag(I) efflux system periplasmic protein CusF